jgi:Ohr subfamily peroxiredoxin
MDAIYTTTATAHGDGRNGHVTSDDDVLSVDVLVPKELGGPGGATNPEQLFAAGYAACFHSALKLVGRESKADLAESAVSATVSLGSTGGGAYGLAVEIDVHAPRLNHEAAQSLVEKAHEVCPYSNATRGNVVVTLNVI